jgi:glucokinase
MATGGVHMGGLAQKIISKLKEPVFMNAFISKLLMRPLILDIPVRIIMNPKTTLLGAARYASIELGE